MKNREEFIASFVLVVFSAVYLIMAFFIPVPALKQQLGPEGFPKAIGVIMLALGCIYLVQQYKCICSAKEKEKAKQKEAEIEKRAVIIGAEEKIEKKADLKTMGFMLGVMLIYAFVFERLGYAVSTFGAFMVGAIYLDRKHLVRDAIIAIIASFVLFYIFSNILRVQLPGGPLTALASHYDLESLANLFGKFGL
jgi:hypothetical protein